MATNIWPGDEGKKSVNATGIAMLFGLSTVMVRSEGSPAPMVPGLKDLRMPIGLVWLTIKVSLTGGAVPLSVTKAPVVFKWSPGTDEVTVAVTVQEPPAGIEPPVKVNVNSSFAIAPPQPLLLALPTNVTPLGNVSANDVVKLAAVLLGLLKVMVRVDVSGSVGGTLMMTGLKALMSVGGTAATEHAEAVMLLASIDTAPLPFACIPARALPDRVAPVLRVMLVCARLVPMKSVVVPRVAELPTCQKTLQS